MRAGYGHEKQLEVVVREWRVACAASLEGGCSGEWRVLRAFRSASVRVGSLRARLPGVCRWHVPRVPRKMEPVGWVHVGCVHAYS